MEINTSTLWLIATITLVVIFGLVWAYIMLKQKLPKMAEEDRWFTTVKKGKIKALKMAGRITGYYGNLADLGMHVERKTGKVVPGKDTELESSELWKEFGVIWLGFGGSVYEYPFRKMEMIDGKVVEVKTNASSIFLKNRFIVSVEDAETKEMVPTKIVAQLITETVHAGLSLNFSNWIGVVEAQVKSACRDFIATVGLRDLTKEQLEKNGKLFEYVMTLNNSGTGNTGLPEQIGQKIIGFSVISLEISDESVKETVQSQELAEERKKGKIADAEGDKRVKIITAQADLEKSKLDAEGIKVTGTARNEILQKTAKLLGKAGAGNLERSRTIAGAIKEFNGKALSLGGNGTSFFVGDNETPEGNTKRGEK